MPESTKNTRSTPTTSVTLNDIKDLIEVTKNEIIDALRADIDRLDATIHSLLARVQNLESEGNLLRKENEGIKEQLVKLKSEVTEYQARTCMSHEDSEMPTEELLHELELRFQRRGNIVLSGIPEESKGSLEERQESDMCKVSCILQEIGVSNFKCQDKPQRIGRSNPGRIRLVRLKNLDMDAKSEILSKARLLRRSGRFNKVFVNPDLTPLQQRDQKRLRDELQKRKNDGEDVIIFRRKIIARNELQNFH